MRSYAGDLQVQDDDFSLRVERLIPRAEEVAFSLVGTDVYGEFRIEGVAKKTAIGTFSTGPIALYYAQYVSEDEAVVRICEVTGFGDKCHIRGEWLQYGDVWGFSGRLGPFR